MQQPSLKVSNQPIAAIDVGSNTIHLVVARPRTDAGDGLDILVDELEFVRLGAGVGTTGRIAPERAERGLAALQRLCELAKRAGAATILGAATEVMRLAANGPEFLARARADLGLDIIVITGEQEAALTFWGALSGWQLTPQQPVAVADLGGGSIELVLGTGAHLDWRRSLPLGSGTLHDRFIHSDPPAPAEAGALRGAVADTLGSFSLPERSQDGRLFIVCGGTATTLLSFARSALHIPAAQASLSREEMAAAIEVLLAIPAEEIAERHRVEAQRARILGTGALVLSVFMEHLNASTMQISQRGIREGMILSYIRHGARWLDAAQRGER